MTTTMTTTMILVMTMTRACHKPKEVTTSLDVQGHTVQSTDIILQIATTSYGAMHGFQAFAGENDQRNEVKRRICNLGKSGFCV
eukprot:467133-Amphidinium_carterae.1